MASELELRTLDHNPALGRLSTEERALIAARMVPQDVRAGEVIWYIGREPSTPGLYLVVSGEVSVAHNARTGAVPVSRTVGPGSVFGESTVLSPGPSAVGARAITPAHLLRLPADAVAPLAREVPVLGALLRDLALLRALEPSVLAALRRSALAQHFSPRMLAELCEVAELLDYSDGQEVLRQGDEAPGFYYVVAGTLRVTLRAEGAAAPVLVDTLHAGDVFGDVALITGQPQPTSVSAWGDVRVARVRVESYRRMLEQSQPQRRGARAPGAEQLAALGVESPAAAAAAPRQGETRLVLSSVRAPVGGAVRLLAEALAADHQDHVLVVTFPRAAGDAPPSLAVSGRVARVELPTDDASAGRRLDELLGRVGARFDYVLLDASGRGDAFIESVRHRVDRAVHLTRDTLAPLPTRALGECPVLHAMLLGGPRQKGASSTMPSMHSGTVRLRLDLETLARRGDLGLGALPPHERRSVGRLARAVSNRRVGVALGGGGAWGYAHAALLRAMREQGVPIDLVAGCSFGALVGAYWCALEEEGHPGMDLLIRRGPDVRRAVLASFITSRAIAALVDRDLEGRDLADLEVPFFPVATDVPTGTQRAIKGGTVGRGVRASGAFPIMFSPVTSTGYRFIDGGIINLVPEDVLVAEGADLVIASNVVSQPAPMPGVPQPLLPGDLGRVLHELNPAERARDMVRSTLILMHSAGSRDAHLADVTYNATPAKEAPWAFEEGAKIARDAEPAVAAVMKEVRDAWQRLARPAVEREALEVFALPDGGRDEAPAPRAAEAPAEARA